MAGTLAACAFETSCQSGPLPAPRRGADAIEGDTAAATECALRGRCAILMLVATGGWYARLGAERAATPGEGSAEVGFARDMSRHHQQAVYMAILAVEHGSTSDVRQRSNDIVPVQQAEIGTMTAWLNNWGVSARNTNDSRSPS